MLFFFRSDHRTFFTVLTIMCNKNVEPNTCELHPDKNLALWGFPTVAQR